MVNKRRERFLVYFDGPPFKGNREALIRRTQLTKGRISQLFDKDQPFGERAAAGLAERLGLPADYFEYDHPTERAAAPPPTPPRDFSDRHEVTDSDWGLLQDVHLVMTDDELAALRTRAERLRRIAHEQLEAVVATAPPPPETDKGWGRFQVRQDAPAQSAPKKKRASE